VSLFLKAKLATGRKESLIIVLLYIYKGFSLEKQAILKCFQNPERKIKTVSDFIKMKYNGF
jgi:hypothetical protein